MSDKTRCYNCQEEVTLDEIDKYTHFCADGKTVHFLGDGMLVIKLKTPLVEKEKEQFFTLMWFCPKCEKKVVVSRGHEETAVFEKPGMQFVIRHSRHYCETTHMVMISGPSTLPEPYISPYTERDTLDEFYYHVLAHDLTNKG